MVEWMLVVKLLTATPDGAVEISQVVHIPGFNDVQACEKVNEQEFGGEGRCYPDRSRPVLRRIR